MNISHPNLGNYLVNGFDRVEGWCSPRLFPIVEFMNSLPINRDGGACEIGVHHGKLYILLNQVIAAHEKSYAIDVFDHQHLNIDHSGDGNRTVFVENLIQYDVHKGRNTTILPYDSTDPAVQLDRIITPGSIRFMSIDGGHTPEHTINDLNLASRIISNQGVVILDDILNHWWMGVIEGVCKFLLSTPTLVPFAVGDNKMYFAKLSYKDYYYSAFNNSPFRTKEITFFGHKILSL